MLVKCEVYSKTNELIGNGLASSEDNITIHISYFVFEESQEVKTIQVVEVRLFDFHKTKLECRVMLIKDKSNYSVRKVRRIFESPEEEEIERIKESQPEKPNNFRDDVRMDIDLESFVISDDDNKVETSVEIRDLSSGGVRFSSYVDLPEDYLFYISVPYREPALKTKIRTIRRLQVGSGYLYGCQFVDLPENEEASIRSWIFGIQAERRKNQLR